MKTQVIRFKRVDGKGFRDIFVDRQYYWLMSAPKFVTIDIAIATQYLTVSIFHFGVLNFKYDLLKRMTKSLLSSSATNVVIDSDDLNGLVNKRVT